jgi:hypothetical protein
VYDYERKTRSTSYFTYEWIQYQIAVVNKSSNAITSNLILGIGKVNPAIYFQGKSDFVRTFNYFLPFEDSLSNIKVSAGGNLYTNVYSVMVLGGEYKSTVTDTLRIAVNPQYGLIKLSIVSMPSKHTWTVIRSFINR